MAERSEEVEEIEREIEKFERESECPHCGDIMSAETKIYSVFTEVMNDGSEIEKVSAVTIFFNCYGCRRRSALSKALKDLNFNFARLIG